MKIIQKLFFSNVYLFPRCARKSVRSACLNSLPWRPPTPTKRASSPDSYFSFSCSSSGYSSCSYFSSVSDFSSVSGSASYVKLISLTSCGETSLTGAFSAATLREEGSLSLSLSFSTCSCEVLLLLAYSFSSLTE